MATWGIALAPATRWRYIEPFRSRGRLLGPAFAVAFSFTPICFHQLWLSRCSSWFSYSFTGRVQNKHFRPRMKINLECTFILYTTDTLTFLLYSSGLEILSCDTFNNFIYFDRKTTFYLKLMIGQFGSMLHVQRQRLKLIVATDTVSWLLSITNEYKHLHFILMYICKIKK